LPFIIIIIIIIITTTTTTTIIIIIFGTDKATNLKFGRQIVFGK